jgi:hypothetical protein
MSSEAITSFVMYPMQTAGDRLVLAGLRSWIAGLHYDDASCWEAGWNVLSNELPPHQARASLPGWNGWRSLCATPA